MHNVLRVGTLLLLAVLALGGCASSGDNRAADDSLSMGGAIDDNDLENRIRDLLLEADERFGDSRVHVVSHNARILLTGRVPERDMINTATDVVRQFSRVRLLHNELRVGEAPGINVRSSDQWLSIRVKGKLVAERGLPSRRVVVTTNEGAVYLMGVLSREQGRLAERLAANIEGVQRVISIFDYTD